MKSATRDQILNEAVDVSLLTNVLFKESKGYLNSEFSFSYISCLTKAKEPS